MSIDSPAETGADRRGLLKAAGFGAAALGALAIAGRPSPAAADGVSATDVLNFALNLEYLEAEFYLRATTGTGLPKSLTNGGSGAPGGTVTGGSAVPFQSARLKSIAQAIAQDELHHVIFLRDALMGSRVAEPAIDLSTSFTTLARAAGIVGPTGTFNPFDNEDDFLLGAFIFEDVGVSAYSGAAGYLANTPYLGYAAGILATEAYHGGCLRGLLIDAVPTLAPAADAVAKLRAQLSGANDDVGPAYYSGRVANVADADSNSIAFARTPQQVLNVVYGGGASSNYLFFPDKLNGAIS
jgi:hypothetical protein